MPIKTCIICGNEFKVKTCALDKAKYCSKKCFHVSLKGKPSLKKGKPLSDEIKAKISEANKGKRHTASTRKKMSQSQKKNLNNLGRFGNGREAPWLGKKRPGFKSESTFGEGHIPWNKGKTGVYSEETRKKMGEATIGRAPWNKGLVGAYSAEAIAKIKEIGRAHV